VSDLERLLDGCNPLPGADGEADCLTRFLDSFTLRAYRRPPTAQELGRLRDLFAVGAESGGFPRGIQLVIEAVLQSPFFLYRLELGASAADGAVRLTPHELAARLSYLLTGSMPDRDLTAAADGGQLATPDGIAAQAKRLLGGSRAHTTLTDMHQRWFGIDGLDDVTKDPKKYRGFSSSVLQAMKNEARDFVNEVLWNGDGRLDTLLSSTVTFVNTSLAPLYGVPAPTGEAFVRVNLDPTQRAGLLTDVAVLTAHTFADESAAIHRGKFVRERLLCTTPPDPPPDIMVVPPTPKAGVSTRQRLTEHSVSPACRGCHQLMDPIGFGFEAYDGIGRWRTTDQGKPIDDTGTLGGTQDIDGPFKGAVELSRKLIASGQVRDCAVSTVLRFAQGPEAAADTCARDRLRAAFESSRHDMRELVIAVTRTDGFQYRKQLAGEVVK